MTVDDDNAEEHRAHRAYVRAVLDELFYELRTVVDVELGDDQVTLDYMIRAIEVRHTLAARLEAIDQALLALSRSRLDEERGRPPVA